ncbi:MAG: heparinase II/III family protein [Oscillospiraceae bacterium]|nr:heparinase II/III family protein [Oscillospiraceae bacterium]
MKRLAAVVLIVLFVLGTSAQATDVVKNKERIEYLFYSSFEDDQPGSPAVPAGWELYDQTFEIIQRDNGSDKCVKINDESSERGAGLRTKHIPVDPGGHYTVSVDMKVGRGAAQYYVEYWYPSGDRDKNVDIINASAGSSWNTYISETDAPDGVSYMTVLLYLHGSNVGFAYYDCVSVRKTPKQQETEQEVKYTAVENGHPRLFYTVSTKLEFISRSKNEDINYAGVSTAAIARSIVSSADVFASEKSIECSYYGGYMVTYEYPLKMPKYMKNPPAYLASGQYPFWTALGGAIKTRLQTLSAAYVLTGDSKYSARAIDICMWLSEWSSWSDPTYGDGTACLDSGYISVGVSTVYDMLYDILTDKQKSTISEALYERALKPHLSVWNKTADHNGQVVITASLATVACAIYGEYELCDKAIYKAIDYFKWYLDRRMTSGTHEGNMYTSLSLEYIMVAADNIARTVGDRSVIEHKYITDFLFKWMVAGGDSSTGSFACFSDGSCSNGFFVTASVANKWSKNGLAGYYLTRAKLCPRSLEGYIYAQEKLCVTEPGRETQSIYLDKIGWGSMRTGWKEGDAALVFSASRSNLGHNHYDNNSFQIALNGVWLASDPGYQDYSPGENRDYTLKNGHSTVYVDGEAQSVLGAADIGEKLSGGFFTLMTGSAASSYSPGLLNKFDRSFLLVNHTDFPYFAVYDELDSENEHEYIWRLNISDATQALIDGKPAEEGRSESSFGFETFYQNSASLRVGFASDNPLSIKYYKYAGKFGKLVDVSQKNSEKSGSCNFLALITADAGTASELNYGTYCDDVAVSDGSEECSYIAVLDRSALLFKPGSEAEWFSVPVSVPATGEYNISVSACTGRDFGSFDIYLGDVFVGGFDGYRDESDSTANIELKNVIFPRGSFRLKLVSRGSNAHNVKAYIGLISFYAKPAGNTDYSVKISQNINTSSVRGCEVSYSGLADILLFSKEENTASYGERKIGSDGSFCAVFGLLNDRITRGYSAVGASCMNFGEIELYRSDKPVNFVYSPGGGSVAIADEYTTLSFNVIGADVGTIYVNGKEKDFTVGKNGMITICLSAGKNYIDIDPEREITIDVSAPEVKNNGIRSAVIFGLLALAAVGIFAAAILVITKLKSKDKSKKQ